VLTIHAADAVRLTWNDPESIKGGAVAVEGGRVAAVGPLAEVEERFPGARLRRWPGTLGPGRIHEGPLPDAPTPRERIHAVLKSGAVAVLEEHVDSLALRSAAERNDVAVLPCTRPMAISDHARADLTVVTDTGDCIATVCAGRLVHRRR